MGVGIVAQVRLRGSQAAPFRPDGSRRVDGRGSDMLNYKPVTIFDDFISCEGESTVFKVLGGGIGLCRNFTCLF
jgi:hypothetical protein